MLKVKYLELNPSSGHYGYRSHNFNVIPEKIKALGQKIQTDCTSNALTIHIAKDKSTDITTISSPLHKRMKTSVPVAESIPGDDDRPLTPMDVYEEGTDDDEREILIKLIPSVVETMKNHGQLETWIQFNQLLSTQSFPMDNITFLLFLDVVRWYGKTSTTQMRYNDTAVNKFWRIGYKMFHGKWLRYMSGPKNKGDLVNRLSAPREFDPKGSRINFSVPFAKVTGTSESPIPSSQIRPGILTHLLDKVSEQTSKDQTFKLCFDGKKINCSISGKYGDIDLFGFEGTPTLAEKQLRLGQERTSVTELIDMFRHQTVHDINSLQRMSQVTKSNAVESIRAVIQVLSYRLKELREAHLAKEMALAKFKKMAGEDWRKSKLLHVISAFKKKKCFGNNFI